MNGTATAATAAYPDACGPRRLSTAWIRLALVTAFLPALIGAAPSGAEAQTPGVQRILFVGLAEGDSTYYLGEAVRVRVVFTQPIAADVAGGRPYVELTVGATTRRAELVASPANRRLQFEYRVQADDFDGDGVGVPANGLKLNGGRVTTQDGTVAADVAHGAAEGGPSRKVDGSRYRPRGPTLAAGGTSVVEGGAGAETALEFEVRLAPASADRVTVGYADAGSGTATAGVDYAEIEAGALTFEPGDTVQRVSVTVRGDDEVEDDETVVLALSGASGAELATATATGTIVDDDEAPPPPPPAPSVQRVLFVGLAEGDSTYYLGEAVRVRVVFTQPIAADVAGGRPYVELTVGATTRRAGLVASPDNRRLQFEYRVQADDFDGDGVGVPANGLKLNGGRVTTQDGTVEADVAHGAAEGGPSRKVDGSRYRPQGPTLAAGGTSVVEGGAGAETALEFEVRLAPASADRVTVGYADAGSGTATAGVDYAEIEAGALTFEPGDTVQRVSVTVRGDDEVEDDETVVLALSGASGAELATATATATGTIVDDDEAPPPPPPAPSVQRVLFVGLAEGDSTYYLGEAVRVRVVFTQPIAADVAGGRPYVELTVGATTRRAGLVASPDNRRLQFEYRVQADDFDGDGVGVPANGLKLNGGRVTTQDGTVEADVAHGAAEGGPSRKVDGSRYRPQGPTLAAGGTSVVEGGAGAETALEFEVRLAPASADRVTVGYADAGSGTATAGVDYAEIEAGTLTFEPGDTVQTVSVTVRGDDEVEDDETVVLALSGASGAELATATATGTIVDDDEAPPPPPPAPSVQRVLFVGLAEGDSTYYLGEAVRVRVVFTQPIAADVAGGRPYVELTVGAATRRAGLVASPDNRRLQFEYRVQADDFDGDGVGVPANGLKLNGGRVTTQDGTVEADVAHGAAEGGPSRKVDGSRYRPQGPTLAAGGTSVVEGGAGAETALEFEVRLAPASADRVTVGYADAGSGTATAGVDYAEIEAGALTFEPGDTVQTVSVTVRGDDEVEDDETVVLALSGASGAELATATATGTIVDDDEAPPPPPPAPSVQRVLFVGLAEGDSTYYLGEAVRVRVVFTQPIAADVAGGRPYVELTVGAATRRAGLVASPDNRRLQFEYRVQADDFDGDGVGVPANGLKLNGGRVTTQDGTVEADVAHGAAEGGPSRKVDGSRYRPQGPTLAAGGTSAVEGGAGAEAALEFEVWLAPSSASRVTVAYADAGSGTATAGVDYAAIEADTLTFEPGETLKTVSVTVRGDDEVEDDETVVLALSGATNAELASRRVTGTIVDDDGSRPTVSIDSATVREPGPGEAVALSFTVSLSAPSARQVTVRYADAGTGTATPGGDYDAVMPGTVVFAAGDTAQTVEVTVRGDALDEPVETIVLALAGPVNADLPNGGARGVGTIVDDDDAPTLSGDSPSVEEGNGEGRRLTFTLALDRPSGRGLALYYADAGTGTATSGADYEEVVPDTLFFEPGETTKSIDVMVLGDTLQELDETVVLRLSATDSSLLAVSTALIAGTIVDDDGEDLAPSFGDAVVPAQRWVRACEIRAVQLPAAEGGDAPLTYGLAPALPLGLAFDAGRRTIAGTPEREQPVTTYRYTATDADGDSATLSFTAQVELLECGLEADGLDADGDPEAVDAASSETPSIGDAGDFDAERETLSEDATAVSMHQEDDAEGGLATGAVVGAQSSALTVQRFNFRGLADGDSTYYRDEVVRVRVFFTQHVALSTKGGKPYLDLTIGTTTRRAEFGSKRQNYLDFRYRVQADDFDGDGVSVPASGLKLNGARITAQNDTSAHANIAHDSAAGGASRKVDGSKYRPPRVRSVTFSNSPASGGTYGYGEMIQARVAFDRRVLVSTTGGTPSLTLKIGGGARQATLSDRPGTRTRLTFSYAVQAGDLAPGGASIAANALRLNGGTITSDADSATNAVLAHGGVRADPARKVDGRPRITSLEFYDPPSSVPPSAGVYGFGERIRILARFDQKLILDDRAWVSLEVGTDTVQVRSSWRLRMGGSALLFTYVVGRGAMDSDGVRVPKGALSLNGGMLKADSDGVTRARLDHGGLPADSSRRVNGSVKPTPRPVVTLTDDPPASGNTYTWNERIEASVYFNVDVRVTGRPRLTMNVGTGTRQLVADEYGGRGPLTFEYVVQAADMDADGISFPANALSLPSGATIRSAADTSIHAALSHDSVPADPQRKVDGQSVQAPKVLRTSIGPPPSGGDTYTRGETFLVGVSFDRDVAVDTTGGRPRVALEIGDSTRYATYRGPPRGRPWELLFVYVVQAGDRDADGVSIKANGLSANGGSITLLGDTTPAVLSHIGLFPTGHKVDGGRVGAPHVRWAAFNAPVKGDTYLRGERIEVTIGFDRVASVDTVGGRPRIALQVGDSTRYATYLGPSRAQAHIRFGYVVRAGDTDTDGLSIGSNAVELNGGTITAPGDTTAAVLTRATVPTSAAHKVDGSRAGVAEVQWLAVGPPPSRDSTYTRGEVLYASVHFDRAVAVDTTGGRPRIALEIGDSTRHATYSHQFTNTPARQVFKYVVQASDRDADGLSVAADALELNGGSITAPDDTVSADLSHAPVAADSAFKVDGGRTGAPHVRWVWLNAPASGDTYLRGEQVVVVVDFDRSASVDTVGGRPRIALQVGDSTRHATYLGAPGARPSYGFTYVVQAGDRDADGLSIAANALELNGGTLTAPGDTAAAVLTHDSVPTSAAHKVDGSRARAAKVQWLAVGPPPSRDSTYTRGEVLYASVHFDRAVAVDTTGGRPRIALEIGDSTRHATYSHQFTNTPARQVFKYVVQASDRDADGLSVAADALELNGGSITAPDDTVSADLSHAPVAADSAFKVDGGRTGAPHVRWVWLNAPASGDTYLRGEQVVVVVDFDRSASVDTVGGRPRIALQVGDSTRHATYLGAPGARPSYGFTYVVQAGDRDADGLSIAANALELNGSTLTAPGDTAAAVLTHDSVPTSAAHKVDGSRAAGDVAAEENRAPEVVSEIAPKTMEVASPPAVVDLSAHFRDPDGDELRYFAASATPRSVRVDEEGGVLTIHAAAVGQSTVTVRAVDPEGAGSRAELLGDGRGVACGPRPHPEALAGRLRSERGHGDGGSDRRTAGRGGRSHCNGRDGRGASSSRRPVAFVRRRRGALRPAGAGQAGRRAARRAAVARSGQPRVGAAGGCEGRPRRGRTARAGGRLRTIGPDRRRRQLRRTGRLGHYG